MMIGDFPGGTGNIEGPVSPHNYKRAVYRQAPAQFSVEMLGPAKQGGNYSFGMRICPLINNDGISLSSRSSNSEYEVWRRWEDCLWFQETIEIEYERLARQKRQRLVKGKGVKKNGMYLQDQAASFESLPPGPDPNSIARDIHDTVPRLTKKGTLFRASQATIEQRQRELTALIEGLFKGDVPMLIQELRQTRIVTDFFGYWRRDHDLALKQPRKDSKPRNSVSSSVFSFYFSQSSISLALPEPRASMEPNRVQSSLLTVRNPNSKRSSSVGSSSQGSRSAPMDYPIKSRHSSDEDLPRSSISQSSCSSSSPSSRDSQGSIISSMSFIVPEDTPVVVEHNAKVVSDYPHRPVYGLESLPEDSELSAKDGSKSPPPMRARARRRSSTVESNRNCQFFGNPPDFLSRSPPTSDQQSINQPRCSVRESWMSGASFLDDLGVVLPDSPVQPSQQPRDSVASFATFMTNNSAEAIIPNTLTHSRAVLRRSLSAGSRQYRRKSLSDDDRSDRDEEIADNFLYDSFPIPIPFSRRDTLGRHSPTLGQLPAQLSRSSIQLSSHSPPSPTDSSFTTFSQSPTTSGPCLAIKAAYNNTIILLRIPSESSYAALRRRLQDKFRNQESLSLPETFKVFFVSPSPSTPTTESRMVKTRVRSNSITTADQSRLHAIPSDAEWEKITSAKDSGKVTLRITD